LRSSTGETLVANPLHKLSKGVVAFIPAFNEESAITGVISKASEYVDSVVVIDDCSDDSTGEVARMAGADVIVHDERVGYGGALRTAFESVRGYKANILVILDGDGQHDPGEIPDMVEPIIREEADVVIGSRFGLSSINRMPRYRRFGIWVITWLTNLVLSTRISDAQSGFRAFSRRAIEMLVVKNLGMGVSTQLLLDADELGLMIKEVPVSVRYDLDGSSKNPLIHGMVVVSQVIGYIANRHPLHFFGVPGIFLLLVGVILGLGDVLGYRSGLPIMELSPLSGLLLLGGGLCLLFGLFFTISGKKRRLEAFV